MPHFNYRSKTSIYFFINLHSQSITLSYFSQFVKHFWEDQTADNNLIPVGKLTIYRFGTLLKPQYLDPTKSSLCFPSHYEPTRLENIMLVKNYIPSPNFRFLQCFKSLHSSDLRFRIVDYKLCTCKEWEIRWF